MALLRSTLLGLCVFGALLGAGCGSDPAAKPQGDTSGDDDDDDDDKGAKKDAGKDAGKADAGKGDAAASAAKTVKCGSKTCTGTTVPQLGSTTPCCFDEDEEICSTYPIPMTSGECPEPVKEAENCPSVMIVTQMAKACCTTENHCGIDATLLNMGCLDLGSPTLAMIPGATIPPPMTCDGEPLEPTTPAPTPDAGKPATTGDAGKSDAGVSSSTDAGKTDAGKTDAGK